MPIYEYRCPKCDKVFEINWKDIMSIPIKHRCPECGTVSDRKFSVFQFSFSPYLRELREGNMLDY